MSADRNLIHDIACRRPAHALLTVAVLVVSVGVFWVRQQEESLPAADRVVQRAELAIEQGDIPAAEALASEALLETPDSPRALLAAAVAAAHQGRSTEAVELLALIGPDDEKRFIQALGLSADLYLHQLGQFSSAEHCLRRLLQQQPDEPRATGQLIRVLFLSGRQEEAASLLREQIASADWQKQPDLQLLHWLANPDSGLADVELLDFARKQAWEDPLPSIGLARIALHRGDKIAAESLIRRSVKLNPELLEAQSLLGEFLAGYASAEKFQHWQEQLPANFGASADIWSVRGLRASLTGDRIGAVRCYLEAVNRNPDSQQSLQGLLDHSDTLAHHEASDRIRRRIRLLKEFRSAVLIATSTDRAVRPVLDVARLADQLDRRDEAVCWRNIAQQRDPTVEVVPRREFLVYPAEVAASLLSGVDFETFSLPDTSLPLIHQKSLAHQGILRQQAHHRAAETRPCLPVPDSARSRGSAVRPFRLLTTHTLTAATEAARCPNVTRSKISLPIRMMQQ